MEQQQLNIFDGETDQRCRATMAAVKHCLPPKNQSDRTGMKNLYEWLRETCDADDTKLGWLPRTLIDYALEASGPKSRNKLAVFMSILRKELRYRPEDRQ
jgi:hypothetical protein